MASWVDFVPGVFNLAILLAGFALVQRLFTRRTAWFGQFAATRAFFNWLRFAVALWALEYFLTLVVQVLLGQPPQMPERTLPRWFQVSVFLIEALMLACTYFGVKAYWQRLRSHHPVRLARVVFGTAIIVVFAGIVLAVVAPTLPVITCGPVVIIPSSIPSAFAPFAFLVGIGVFLCQAYRRLQHRTAATWLFVLMLAYGITQLVQGIDLVGDDQHKLLKILLVPSAFFKATFFSGLVGLWLTGRSNITIAHSLGMTAVVVDSQDRVISRPRASVARPLKGIQLQTPVADLFHEEDARHYSEWCNNPAGRHKSPDIYRLKTGEFVRVERLVFGRADASAGTAGGATRLLAEDEAIVIFHIQDPEYMNAAFGLWTSIEHMLRGNLDHVSALLTDAAKQDPLGRVAGLVPVCTHLMGEITDQIHLIQYVYAEMGFAKPLIPSRQIDLVELLGDEITRWRKVLAASPELYNVSVASEPGEGHDGTLDRLIQFESTRDTFVCDVPAVVVKTTLREMLLNALTHRSHGPVKIRLESGTGDRPVIRASNEVRGLLEREVMQRVSAEDGGIELVRRALRYVGSYLKYDYVKEPSPRLTAVWKIDEVSE